MPSRRMDYNSSNNSVWTLLAMVVIAAVVIVVTYYLLIGIIGVTFYIIGVAFYFLPALVAMYRQHRNAVAIFVVNLLFGWTFVAWAIALVWAFTNPD